MKPYILHISLAAMVAFVGCSDAPKPITDDTANKPVIDSTRAFNFKVGDENVMFSIPSPVQTAILIKNTGAEFDKGILNDPNNAASYSTKFQRALNLGIYGADLGYVNLYEQTQDALNFLRASKKLGDELGVSGAFTPELNARFEANLGKKDSLLVLVSEAYRSIDSYLKSNDRDDVGSLVLAGGWIEALYFATSASKNGVSPEVSARIGEQKTSLESLINLLKKYSNNEDVEELINDLIDLYHLFDEVQYSYTFVEPTHDADNKVTKINSKSEVVISPEQITAIANQIENIRNLIVG